GTGVQTCALPIFPVAVMRALISAKVQRRRAGKMFCLLVLNTLLSIFGSLLVANVIRPGRHAHLPSHEALHVAGDPVAQLIDNIPASLLRPLVDNNVIGVIIIAVAFALAARGLDPPRVAQVLDAVEIVFDLILIVLHRVIALVPIAVFFKVALVVGKEGVRPFVALAWFIGSVIVALVLQGLWYLLRVRLRSWVRPIDLMNG